MGANQSVIENFQDPGPGVTELRVLEAVKKHEGTDDVRIESIAEHPNDVGQGFMSTLVRIKVSATVKGESRTFSWVVKSMPRNITR